jgi:hypothetical protein
MTPRRPFQAGLMSGAGTPGNQFGNGSAPNLWQRLRASASGRWPPPSAVITGRVIPVWRERARRAELSPGNG